MSAKIETKVINFAIVTVGWKEFYVYPCGNVRHDYCNPGEQLLVEEHENFHGVTHAEIREAGLKALGVK